jgi:dTDP-D-glucose 4,6-dehydratase
VAKKQLSKDIKFKTVETQEEEIDRLEISNQKIKEKLGWKPTITPEEGVADLFEKYLWQMKTHGSLKEPAVIKTPTRTTI